MNILQKIRVPMFLNKLETLLVSSEVGDLSESALTIHVTNITDKYDKMNIQYINGNRTTTNRAMVMEMKARCPSLIIVVQSALSFFIGTIYLQGIFFLILLAYK